MIGNKILDFWSKYLMENKKYIDRKANNMGYVSTYPKNNNELPERNRNKKIIPFSISFLPINFEIFIIEIKNIIPEIILTIIKIEKILNPVPVRFSFKNKYILVIKGSFKLQSLPW